MTSPLPLPAALFFTFPGSPLTDPQNRLYQVPQVPDFQANNLPRTPFTAQLLQCEGINHFRRTNSNLPETPDLVYVRAPVRLNGSFFNGHPNNDHIATLRYDATRECYVLSSSPTILAQTGVDIQGDFMFQTYPNSDTWHPVEPFSCLLMLQHA